VAWIITPDKYPPFSADYFAINDRIIEMSSVPLPKEQKKEVAKKIEEWKEAR